MIAILMMLAAAQAPFSSLGLEPIGVPRGAATALEQRLPERPFLAASMSWGDPSLLHASIDRLVPLDQIPEPFAAIAKYMRALIFGASRCGLSGLSVTRPPPWKEAPAPMRSGTAAAVFTTSGPPMQ